MKKQLIPILLLTLFLIVILSFTTYSKSNYIKIPEYNSLYTKAICTSENFCQDYQFYCNDSGLVARTPLTGAAVQFPKNWQDSRTSEMMNTVC